MTKTREEKAGIKDEWKEKNERRKIGKKIAFIYAVNPWREESTM